MESGQFVDQKLQQIQELVESRPESFAAQGSVVATWRTYRGKRTGPYFRLAFRDGNVQRSVYLGKSPELADRVRALLGEKKMRLESERNYRKTRARVVSELRKQKRRWQQDLKSIGLKAKGFEVRGWKPSGN